MTNGRREPIFPGAIDDRMEPFLSQEPLESSKFLVRESAKGLGRRVYVGLDMKLGDSRPVEIGPLSSKGDTRSGSHPLVSQTQRHLLLSTHPMSRWRGRSRRYNKIEEEHTERDASCHKNRADRPRVGGGRASEQKRQDVEVKRHEERAGEPPVYVDQAKKNHCEKGHSGDCEPRLA
jgi:hypothetical protein